MDLREAIKKKWQEYTEELHKKKKILMTWITKMVWSLTESQTSWNKKSGGPYVVSLWTKLVVVNEL